MTLLYLFLYAGFFVAVVYLIVRYTTPARFRNYKSEEFIKPVEKFTSQDILDEMDADMEDSGMAQGEIESNLNHWRNKYLITWK